MKMRSRDGTSGGMKMASASFGKMAQSIRAEETSIGQANDADSMLGRGEVAMVEDGNNLSNNTIM